MVTDARMSYAACGARYDLIEHGGGAASCTVISPAMFNEFCVGGDLKGADRDLARDVLLGAKVALIGGIDQGAILTNGTPQQVRNDVHACFETYGKNGGYICSASDHFFHAPVENLKSMAQAAAECWY